MNNLNELLSYIPSDDYEEWIQVGMALKEEGESIDVWDSWSRGSSKYKQGECEKRWRSFDSHEITGGTIYHLACQYGYKPDEIHYDVTNLVLDEYHVDPTFVSRETIPELKADEYDAQGEMLEYFTTLFEPEDFVGLCLDWMEVTDSKGKTKLEPIKVQCKRTAGDIIKKLRNSTIEHALGTIDTRGGAWVRFNPLNGKGDSDKNVTRFKHCLLESDEIDTEKQYGLIKSMNLPCTFVVSSGGKSLHALVRVDAENENQYQERVRELYDFAEKSGFKPDGNDKNASRFSRLPGVKRGDKWQYIVARNIGAASYDEWIKWRIAQADDLPPETSLSDVWNDMPPLKEELIPGILRVGHKLLLAGPSKAGKSFLLMDLAVSIAEGVDWLGMECKQGRVCYINLELDDASCLHRFRDIYEKRGIEPENLKNLDVWNLRGRAVPMDRLAQILINRFKEREYIAVIIDPIYKVITGDENNATEMSKFCSHFDQVATELKVAMIYCHHHSKGASGKYANAADRSSGSGVFARDPDAIIDLRELKVDGFDAGYRKEFDNACNVLTGWEVSSTLREFEPMPPFRCWFDHPIHRRDDNNYLGAAKYADSADSARGVSDGQTGKEDWYDIVEEMLGMAEAIGDTAVTLEAVGISKSNAGKTFSSGSNYEVATLDGEKVVHHRDEYRIVFKGGKWEKCAKGRRVVWIKSE